MNYFKDKNPLPEIGKTVPFIQRVENKSRIIIIGAILHHEDYVETNPLKFAEQLEKIASRASVYATKYGYSTGDLAEMVKDAAAWRFYVTKHEAVPEYAKAWTDKGKQMLHGTGTANSIWPVAPDVTTPPDEVKPGIETRYRSKVQKAKGQTDVYLRADGLDMGFESVLTEFIPENGEPELSYKLIDGGHPQIIYSIGQFEQIEILKDWGDGKGFIPFDKTPNSRYVDNSPLPAKNVSAVWKYQAIFWFDAKRTGKWSKELTVPVLG